MKKLLKSFIDLDKVAYWLLKSESTAEFINSIDNVTKLWECEMNRRQIKFNHDAKLIERLNLNAKESKKPYDANYDKKLSEFEIIKNN